MEIKYFKVSWLFGLKLFFLIAFIPELSAQSTFKSLPKRNKVFFRQNDGQVLDQKGKERQDILFSGSSNGLDFHISKSGISYQLSKICSWEENFLSSQYSDCNKAEMEKCSIPNEIKTYRVDISWIGANKNFKVVPMNIKDDYDNYYLTSCPNGILNVPSYERLVFQHLYDGVDVVWYDDNGFLKYDFIIQPGVDYTKIKWTVDGAKKIWIGAEGQLILETPLGIIEEMPPIATQLNEKVDIQWHINGNEVGFSIDEYDPKVQLRIDPLVRQWATYYGGNLPERGFQCIVDNSKNTILVGQTFSVSNIATSGAHQTIFVGDTTASGGVTSDGFIVKFDSTGKRIWGTYYGGSEFDVIMNCFSLNNGDILLSGYTHSDTGIATNGSYQNTLNGFQDCFLVKLSSSGLRQWSTYYGGEGGETISSMTLDNSGNIILAGYTTSGTKIASSGAYSRSHNGGLRDGFLAKFDSTGTRLWGTYYGGLGEDYILSCITDSSGNIIISGSTSSKTGIATSGSFQPNYAGGSRDGFIVKFTANGVRRWGTYLGGLGSDNIFCSVLDNNENIILCGSTTSFSGIATSGAYRTFLAGDYDAILAKFNSYGSIQWATYFGGLGEDIAYSCDVDSSGKIVMVGKTESLYGISTPFAYQKRYGGGYDAYFAKFSALGSRIEASYYGGARKDCAWSCFVESNGDLTITGETGSIKNISTIGSHQRYTSGIFPTDAFLTKFITCDLSAFIVDQSNLECKSDSNGIVEIGVNKESLPVSYLWNDGDTLSTNSFLGFGDFQVTVTDSKGCTSVINGRMEYLDTIPPNVMLNDISIYLDSNGNYFLRPLDIIDNFSDNCMVDTFYLDRYYFDCSDMGKTKLTLTITDINGNTTVGYSNVNVQDTIPPTIQLEEATFYLDPSGLAVIKPEAIIKKMYDNCLIDTFYLSQDSLFCENVGQNQIIVTLKDINGNMSNENVTVNLVDTLSPIIITKSIDVYLDSTGYVNISPKDVIVQMMDNCTIDTVFLSENRFSCADLGQYKVRITAVDGSGNRTSNYSFINVKDTLPYIVKTRNHTLYLNENGKASITAENLIEYSNDNCPLSFELSKSEFNCSDEGIVPVVLYTSDKYGFYKMDSLYVEVIDTLFSIGKLYGPDKVIEGKVATYRIDSLDEANYNWSVSNGSVYSFGATAQVILTRNNIPSTIQVVQTVKSGCKDSTSLSIGQLKLFDDRPTFELYPNPSNGLFNIKNTSGNINNIDIRVYSLLGSLVFQETNVNIPQSELYQLDLSALSKSMYYVEIKIGTNQIFHFEVLKY